MTPGLDPRTASGRPGRRLRSRCATGTGAPRRTRSLSASTRTCSTYQLPGGMISNLVSQSRSRDALDRLDEVFGRGARSSARTSGTAARDPDVRRAVPEMEVRSGTDARGRQAGGCLIVERGMRYLAICIHLIDLELDTPVILRGFSSVSLFIFRGFLERLPVPDGRVDFIGCRG